MTQVTIADEWAGAALRSRRETLKLTQEALADRARINRSRYNALENGKYAITLTYARRLAPLLQVEPDELLPPPPPAEGEIVKSPLVLLRELSETVDDLQSTYLSLEDRIEVLERASAKGRRAREGH